ncbi:thioesterase family protein [Mesorhizobium muleiense]|uniref:thioesterase family protein n=1 Tax=Mesorhizobium muleiense TaxID=1004279 RepID=UPI001F242D9C|nr:thioesterase family protein [Mesorhizobium muleiense]MCF6110409.1 thioesterase family protein [Mesorhizobium muleiense]
MPAAAYAGDARDERPQQNALLTLETSVDAVWIDYNGHMTEWQYYKVLADAGESFLRALGFTEEYRFQGYSFFSVHGTMRNLKECRVGTQLNVYTEMIGYDPVRLHIYQYVLDQARDLTVATGEHLMLHVDTQLRKRTPVGPYMAECLGQALAKWRPILKPRGLGASLLGASY